MVEGRAESAAEAATSAAATEAPVPRDCLDCGRPVTTRFCPHCGQRRDLRPLSLHGLIWELLIEILDTDARVWRTLRCLVREPGQLTLDWAAGRRMRHVPPFRLYLVLNVLLFLVFSLSNGTPNVVTGQDEDYEARAAQLEAQLAELEGQEGPGIAGQRRGLEVALAAIRSAQTQRPEEAAEEEDDGALADAAREIQLTTDPEVESFLARFGIERERVDAAVLETIENPRAFGERVYERIPTVMILLLPMLALALSVLYLFTGRPYVVHLVGLAHLHAFFFLLLLLLEGFDGFGKLLTTLHVPALPSILEGAPIVGLGVSFWYVTSWLKRLYGHGTAGAMGMSFVLLTLHLVGVAVGVGLALVVTLLASASG